MTFVVHDANGALVSRSPVMGADATATLTVPPCGMVSVVAKQSNADDVTTWTAVMPGDHLGLRSSVATVPRDLGVHLAALSGATSYQIIATCSPDHQTTVTAATPGVVAVAPDCPLAATMVSVLATATTPSGTSTALTTVPLVATGTTDVSLPAYQPAGTSTARLHHATAFAGGDMLYLSSTTIGTDRELSVGFTNNATIAGADASAGPVPAIAGPGVEYLLVRAPSGGITITRGVADAATDFDVDTADLVPLPAGSVDASTTRPTVTWTVDRPFDADVIIVGLASAGVLWGVYAPPIPGTLQFPALPADLVPAQPATTLALSLLDATSVTSYRQLLAGAVVPVIPAPGEQIQIIYSGTAVPRR